MGSLDCTPLPQSRTAKFLAKQLQRRHTMSDCCFPSDVWRRNSKPFITAVLVSVGLFHSVPLTLIWAADWGQILELRLPTCQKKHSRRCQPPWRASTRTKNRRFSTAGFYEEALGRASFKLDSTERLTIEDFEKRELIVPASSRWNSSYIL